MRLSRPACFVAALSMVALAGCRTVERQPVPPPSAPSMHRLVVTATAYNSTRAQTDDRPLEGAWGQALRDGVKAIAVSADLVRLGLGPGTHVEIEGLPGVYEVRDRLPGGRRRAIDVFMGSDVRAARRWGKRTVEIRWSSPPRETGPTDRD